MSRKETGGQRVTYSTNHRRGGGGGGGQKKLIDNSVHLEDIEPDEKKSIRLLWLKSLML